ncbi:MAG: alpha-E domain-containing protein [Chloroflexi bacterium AL-W]|nr:alpha-E domain-containing protein [Chloroflexi bacterium AL-N1]NOK67835.1 alpha-E domain-containing protein [Chloroflexi bacterium AL-N10]NOK75396.1 alpha-E domain-containing protein [Chloroflexi bacterium AL-N5]NOK82184.1 alpha-E domain-containing protein [Chloroflexi bacterium AL-W]NOK90029.1 alpha-E domain-containing protein [Chloroflexi bacterium AL-N15]
MLSRVADSLYWMCRYLERSEHTARVIDLNLHQMLDQTPESSEHRWERVLASLRATLPDDRTTDAYNVTQALTFDAQNPSSIVSCITAARDNARQVREQLSTEMWEQLNRLYLAVKRLHMDDIWSVEPHEFFRRIKEGAHLFQGVTDTTMSHDQGWQFIQAGRYIERASTIATLLEVYLLEPTETVDNNVSALDYLGWVGLLKSCTAFEAYCKVYTADVQPGRILEFLLLNDEFPHSVRFSSDALRSALRAITVTTGGRPGGRAERMTGRLSATLDYGQVDEIVAEGLGAYLADVQHQCTQIHNAIYQTYVSYPIDTAITQ